MADLNKTISIIFGGEDKLSPTVTDVIGNLNKVDAAVLAIANPLAKVTDSILAVDAALAAMATAFLGFAENEAVKFQSAQSDLKKVLDDTDPAVGEFTKTVDELSVRYGIAAESILAGIANFKEAGFTAKESAILQKDALDLVIAGDIEASQASDLLVASLKGFNLPASEARSIIDSLNAVSNKYATDVEQLAIGLAKLSPVAKRAGLSFQETEALLTPVIEVFRSGDEAATALKTGLLKLIDDSKPVTSALESIGVAQKDSNGHLRSAKDILIDVSSAFQGLDDKQKLYVTSQLVGIEQAARMVQVFDNLGKTTEITAVAINSAGSASAEVAIRLQTAEQQIKSAEVAFKNLARAVGTELLANTGDLAGGVTALEVAFKKVVESGGLAPLFDALRPQLDAFSEQMKRVAENLPAAFEGVDFSGLLDSLKNISEEAGALFENFFGKLDLSTPEGLRDALQKIIDTLKALGNITAGIIKAFRPLAAQLGEFILQTGQSSEETQKLSGNILGMAKLVTELGSGFAALSLAIGESKSTITSFADVVVGAFGLLKNGAEIIFETLTAAVVNIANMMLKAFDAATFRVFHDKIESASRGLVDVIQANGAAIVQNGDEARAALDKLGGGLSGLFADAPQGAQATAAGLKEVGDEAGKAGAAVASFKPIDLGDLDPVAEAAKRLGISLKDAKEQAEELNKVGPDFATPAERAQGFKRIIDELGNVTYVGLGKIVSDTTGKIVDQGSAMDKVGDKAKEFDLKLREIASKERIAIIEGKFKVDEAEINAAAERVKAAFSSINTGIESTGKLLGDLFNNFTKSTSEWDKSIIQDAIREEQKRRDQEFELQKQLTEEEITYLKARTNAINRGEALIRVEAANLAPALEKIFDEILKMAQVKANQEGLELLLGI